MYQKSYDAISSKFWDEFKAKLGRAEGVHDTKDVFSKKIAKMLNSINEELDVLSDDFTLDCHHSTFKVSERVKTNPIYQEMCEKSDMPAIIAKYAEAACHKVTHLEHAGKETNGKKVIH